MDVFKILDIILLILYIILLINIMILLHSLFFNEKKIEVFKNMLHEECKLIDVEKEITTPSKIHQYLKRTIDIFLAIYLLLGLAPIFFIIRIKNKFVNKRDRIVTVRKKIIGFMKNPIYICVFNKKGENNNNKCSVAIPIVLSLLKGDISLVGLSISNYDEESINKKKLMDAYKYDKPGILSIHTIMKDIPQYLANDIYLKHRNLKIDIMIVITFLKTNNKNDLDDLLLK